MRHHRRLEPGQHLHHDRQLVGAGLASQFTFASAGALSATSLYNLDPAKSAVGALNIKLPNGSQLDVVANNVVSSGQIAADLKLRDRTLVQAQNQIDQFAATMSSALSDKTTAGSTVSGPPAGFDVDLAGAQPGNTVNFTYTDTTTNTQKQVTLVNVTDPAALPLQNATNANPMQNGVNFSGGMGAIASALNTAHDRRIRRLVFVLDRLGVFDLGMRCVRLPALPRSASRPPICGRRVA